MKNDYIFKIHRPTFQILIQIVTSNIIHIKYDYYYFLFILIWGLKFFKNVLVIFIIKINAIYVKFLHLFRMFIFIVSMCRSEDKSHMITLTFYNINYDTQTYILTSRARTVSCWAISVAQILYFHSFNLFTWNVIFVQPYFLCETTKVKENFSGACDDISHFLLLPKKSNTE